MLKRLFPYFLFGIFTIQLFGFTVFFNFEKSRIKKEIKTKLKADIPENELKIFIFSPQEYKNLNFLKEEKEFIYQNRFFDIMKKNRMKDGKIKLICIDDKQESELHRKLAILMGEKLGGKKTHLPLKTVFSILQLPFIAENNCLHLSFQSFSIEIKHFFASQNLYLSLNKQIQSPPPKNFA